MDGAHRVDDGPRVEEATSRAAEGAPLEWWERLGARRAAWWGARPGLARRVARVANVVTWGAVVVLLLALVLWPHMRWSVRVVIGVMWMMLCWGVLARTKTMRLSSLFRIMSASVPWSVLIGVVSTWISVGMVGLDEANTPAASVVVASIVEEVLKLGPLALLAVVAPGRVRRFAVVDWAMVGFAAGLGFEMVEEGLRRLYYMNRPGS